MDDRRTLRFACLAPLVLAAPFAVFGDVPLGWPLAAALGVGLALRGVEVDDGVLLAAASLGLLAPWAPAQLVGALGVAAVGLRGCRRVAAAPVALGLGAVVAAVALDPEGPATVLRQLRLLALGAGGLMAVLGLWLLADGSRGAIGRRAAGVAAVCGLWALCTEAAAAWPDGWRLASPYLVWAAPALAGLGVLGGSRASVLVAAGPASAALPGALTGTAAGIDGATWALAGAALAVGLADGDGRLERRAAATSGGLPGGLSFVAAAGALWAAATAVHPAPLLPAVVITAGLLLLAPWLALRAGSEGAGRDRWVAAGLVVAGLALAAGARPTRPAAEAAATAVDGHRLPIDDMRGWRRLSRLAAPPPPSAPDAGAP